MTLMGYSVMNDQVLRGKSCTGALWYGMHIIEEHSWWNHNKLTLVLTQGSRIPDMNTPLRGDMMALIRLITTLNILPSLLINKPSATATTPVKEAAG